MQIVMAQINTVVGDYAGNTEAVLAVAHDAAEHGEAPLVAYPELTLSGYPPEDLLLRPSLGPRMEQCIDDLKSRLPRRVWAVVGYPRLLDGQLFNCAGVFHGGELVAEYHKRELPNYRVFDEKRYFTAGTEPCIVPIEGIPVGLSICEDIWVTGPTAAAVEAGAELLINLNASPYHRGKQAERRKLVAERAKRFGIDIVYVNQVGGQDELVFDGGSFATASTGEVTAEAPRFREERTWLSVAAASAPRPRLLSGTREPDLDELAATWQALVLGVRDYVNKNGFPGVVLGLSGGVDSALTLAVAVDALGPERVEAVMMPFRYTSSMSIEDAAEQSQVLGVRHSVIAIEAVYDAFIAALADEFAALIPTQRKKTCRRAVAVCCSCRFEQKGLAGTDNG